jgi:mannose-6-phosphate isomerase-like protein (cupin superfamily)
MRQTRGGDMTGWVGNVDKAVQQNSYFRQVLATGAKMQLVAMTLQPGEDIGLEAHADIEQLIKVEAGRATVSLGPSEDKVTEAHEVEAGWAVIVPPGTWHNVVNRGEGELRLSTIYAPPEHPEGTVHRTKADAVIAEAEHT